MIITVRQTNKTKKQKTDVLSFKYLSTNEVFNFMSKNEWVSIHSYNTRKEASLAESLNLATVNKKFYVVRSTKINGNGIFFDKRDALRFKNDLKEFNSVLNVEPNLKAAYNLIGQRKLAVNRIKEAEEVFSKTIVNSQKDITSKGLELMKDLILKSNLTKESLNLKLKSSKLKESSIKLVLELVSEEKTNAENVSKNLEKGKEQVVKATEKKSIQIEVAPIITGINVKENQANETTDELKVDKFVDKTQNKKNSQSKRNSDKTKVSTQKRNFFVESVTSKSNMNPSVKIYCDGSYSPELGGFYGYAAYENDVLIAQKTGFVFDGLFGKSSGGAENMSIINALEWAYSNDIKEVEIFYDAVEDNVNSLLVNRTQNPIRTNYRNFIESFLNVMDIKLTYVQKNESIHHIRHNLINNLIYNKRDIITS